MSHTIYKDSKQALRAVFDFRGNPEDSFDEFEEDEGVVVSSQSTGNAIR